MNDAQQAEISTAKYKEIITTICADPDAMDFSEESKKEKAVITFKYNNALLKRAIDKEKSF